MYTFFSAAVTISGARYKVLSLHFPKSLKLMQCTKFEILTYKLKSRIFVLPWYTAADEPTNIHFLSLLKSCFFENNQKGGCMIIMCMRSKFKSVQCSKITQMSIKMKWDHVISKHIKKCEDG